jgi:hypothetical protein
MNGSKPQLGSTGEQYACVLCSKTVTEREALSFGGTFAHEQCIREYYSKQEYSATEVNEEVKTRKAAALRINGKGRPRVSVRTPGSVQYNRAMPNKK